MSRHARDCNTQVGFSNGEICNCHPLLTEKVKHTSGPWDEQRIREAIRNVGELGGLDDDEFGEVDDAALDANARLISASPEMLSALERVWDSRHEPDKWSLEVSRALEKATGQAHPFMGARELRDIRRAKGE